MSKTSCDHSIYCSNCDTYHCDGCRCACNKLKHRRITKTLEGYVNIYADGSHGAFWTEEEKHLAPTSGDNLIATVKVRGTYELLASDDEAP